MCLCDIIINVSVDTRIHRYHLAIDLTPEQIAELKILAIRRQTSVKGIVKELIIAVLERLQNEEET